MKTEHTWRLIGVSHPIADTGDYSGHYEITDGNMTIITHDDDAEALQPIVDALNDSGCSFYFDNSALYLISHENDVLRDSNAELLEALKGVFNMRPSDTCGCELGELELQAWDKVRQAIAKAEGA
jgi:hypothetical protein